MSHSAVIGVDTGGSKVEIIRFSDTFDVEDKKRFPTQADRKFDAVYGEIVEGVQELMTPNVRAIGIGVPGLVRQPDGIIQTLPNIPGGENFPLKERFEKSLNLPVFVDNDANCFTLGVAKNSHHNVIVGITLGTGVGGGIVIDGKIFHGAHGFAAEIGHMLLRPGQPPYETDDKRGEIEQFFSGTAMGKRCEAARDPNEYLEGEVCAFMHKDIYREIAWMCTNLIHLLDPGAIVFGGSAGRALEPHLDTITTELQTWLLPGTPIPELIINTEPHAPALGAALLTANFTK